MKLSEYVTQVINDPKYGHDFEWVKGNLHRAHLERIEAAHDAEVRAGVIAEEPEWEYEVTYSSASAPTIDGHRLRRSSGMLPSLAAVAEWMKFAVNPIAHRRTKAIPAGEWERLPTQQEGPDDV